MRGGQPLGEPYTASVSDTFEGGWRFRLHMRPARAGFLYLVTEGPDKAGAKRLWILYPKPDAAASVTASQDVETRWYVFDANPGTETLWLVWSAAPVEAIQKGLSESTNGRVESQDTSAIIERLLTEKASREPEGKRQLTGELLQLKHR